MRLTYLFAAAGLTLAGCSTTPDSLKTSTAPQVTTYPTPYQEVYRRVVNEARVCYGGGIVSIGTTATGELDAELYPDLGFGEVSSSMVNHGVRNYYWSAKIEKEGAGTRMTVHAGNSLDAPAATARLQNWAAGGSGC